MYVGSNGLLDDQVHTHMNTSLHPPRTKQTCIQITSKRPLPSSLRPPHSSLTRTSIFITSLLCYKTVQKNEKFNQLLLQDNNNKKAGGESFF